MNVILELSAEKWWDLRLHIETSNRRTLQRYSLSTLEKVLRTQSSTSRHDAEMLIVIGDNVTGQGMRSQIVTTSDQFSQRSQVASLDQYRKC